MNMHKEFFAPAMGKLATMNEGVLSDLIARVPDDWMTATAREFTITLLCYNLGQLNLLHP